MVWSYHNDHGSHGGRTTLMITIMMALTCLVLMSTSYVAASSNGASGCLATSDDVYNFKQSHGEALNPGITGDTSIQFSAATFVAGCMYTISICGPNYNGFLLAVRDMMTNVPVGHFTDPSLTTTQAKLMTCGYSDNAVTHTMATAKGPLHFKWRAPTAGAADAHFYLTTVRDTTADWYSISEMFSVDESTTDCPSVPETNECPAEGASAGPVMDHSMTMSMQMSMKFSTAWSGLNIVFPNWVLNTKTAYVATVLAMFLLAAFAEWGTTMSIRMDRYFTMKNVSRARKAIQPLANVIASSPISIPMASPSSVVSVAPATSSAPVGGVVPASDVTRSDSMENAAVALASAGYTDVQHVARTFVKLVLQFLALFLMIVFMILDVGLCCSMLAGYGVGFYLFGRDRAATTECH